ncbi:MULTISPECIES: phosphogluconate dehydratase [unclassified Undibacterium]|uniref:phosphogluconate dehydratase n=1 Tax=unclassified Undibacterium TaxID=2630295 RepID=UPI002AC89F92|nr:MULTISPECIES: phosphogluconate dehydratase [unclassified Undibacterium]MEB0139174.1 phosphogluconate dehydratase [Undibacterium sp. CCC2.1]MEB0172251.1 phosphogluconate dehydratase [Undibacterium sp. CCC1.1]MEB0175892.1 phosphogluconate dehydratase [Undibacterium sp. CCC3.4]MEB0215248.1 phosphogluconate dehydratase [Undibacterium sp. 5I2]WPX43546.1 phosphogluconate dehydratase [Undibacterium sp. CCC3.4]
MTTSTTLHPVIDAVTNRIISRSKTLRSNYLSQLEQMRGRGPRRASLSCANQAHANAAMDSSSKIWLNQAQKPNIGIVTAYNDMLSAHQPYESYPQQIRQAALRFGATAQVAGAVPAMCDGVTQGRPGMELSLFSRDVIAQATAVALSHDAFDATLCLGICDKIVPGLLIGALAFGHLPTIFIPAGPMGSGLSNKAKALVRERYAQGKASKEELLASESAAYHSAGTCTFYGTANSNQMLLEAMGLHLPGAAFIHPEDPLRSVLTDAAVERVLGLTEQSGNYKPIGQLVNEKTIVNAIIALLATGGSTNHTIHWIAVARAAGILIDWQDFDELSAVIPLLTRVYPNGTADVNAFEEAGGPTFVLRELLRAGLMHGDVMTVYGEQGLHGHTRRPVLSGSAQVAWTDLPAASPNEDVVRNAATPFAATGGLRLLQGNIGRAIVKASAVPEEAWVVRAPALVFTSQDALVAAYKAGQLNRDFVAVVIFQGPRANGMPELHHFTPILGSLMSAGFKVALVTDGRMSGASGRIPAALHVSPEVAQGGALGKVRDGDLIEVNVHTGQLLALVDAAEWEQRSVASHNEAATFGYGRDLFATQRRVVTAPEHGASTLFI